MKRLGKAFLTGLLLAIAGTCFVYTPYGQRVEEEFGLSLLFKLRGPRQPPEKAVIVNIDSISPGNPELSGSFGKLPRTVHAALVDRLTQYGAAVIAFDIYFAETANRDQDTTFAEAIRRAGNVILVEDLRHAPAMPATGPTGRGAGPAGNVEMEILVPPIQPLADAAFALVPFPLPKIPIRVNQSWRFKESCGDMPTLPAAVFQAATLSHYDRLHALLRQKVPDNIYDLPASAEEAMATLGLVETMRKIRRVFLRNEKLREELLAENRSARVSGPSAGQDLLTLINMYGGESRVVIDFYGPPATCTTLSYHDVLSPPEDTHDSIAEKIRNKVVFVGAARMHWSNQKDGFYTVYSRPDGLDLSGVELAATVFANLVENRSVHPLSAGKTIGLIGFCALAACLLSFLLSPPLAAALLLAGIGVYLFGASAVFSQSGTWTPLITPIVLVPASGFLIATFINYLATHRERRNIHTALGFYLPGSVVEELTHDLSFITTGDRKMYSVCVMTDAQHYTTLSERMEPEELSIHMKAYYQYLFREVKRNGGMVCNVIGDSMLALWPSAEPETSLCRKACQASLQMVEAVERFNGKYPGRSLPTRIGIHAGYLLMDNIGAEDHFEYAPVGDIVNTASRIEGLNKHLGTRILASEETLRGVAGIRYREIGTFLLGGKTRPVGIYELLAEKEYSAEWNRLYKEVFPEAVWLFRQGLWHKALAVFDHCLTVHAEDGPTRFYKQLCESYLVTPPAADRQEIIRVDK
ncbi:MAG: hypothetical protein VR65_20125 [Desulfobulbaceae bacterium BRH_c16a]|nr:MAG: hypothetical protein VR65_20125 [Desulfobulbaceae bacterium BRH_c16a]